MPSDCGHNNCACETIERKVYVDSINDAQEKRLNNQIAELIDNINKLKKENSDLGTALSKNTITEKFILKLLADSK